MVEEPHCQYFIIVFKLEIRCRAVYYHTNYVIYVNIYHVARVTDYGLNQYSDKFISQQNQISTEIEISFEIS